MQYNISRDQHEQLETDRRDSLARYLVNQPRQRQATFLKAMKSEALRNDICDRMRRELSLQIARMEPNVRRLRLARLRDSLRGSRNDLAFYQDILTRFSDHIDRGEGTHG
ncbi:hypothetical protein GCM10023116_13330 [Kistimonas scapharcae]|uniref:Uncharacterized protein n=1 Tax=Kistimonas scapharcae TaxID=1036133 RepID=A0ABP8UZ83_9GAMM